MLTRAARAAATLGCDLQVPLKKQLGHPGQQLIFEARSSSGLSCKRQAEIACVYENDSNFWWGELRRHGPAYASLESMMDRRKANTSQLVNSMVNGFLGHNETHVGGLPCSRYKFDLAMQIRAGDVFRGAYNGNGSWLPFKVHPGYAQPPLSFYIKCLQDNLQPGQRAVAVCQDFTNPVAATLRMMARSSSLAWNLTVVSLPNLNETLATLGCAPVVCGAKSSFSSVYSNSFHTKRMVKPTDGELRQVYEGHWMNTAKQRERMLTEDWPSLEERKQDKEAKKKAAKEEADEKGLDLFDKKVKDVYPNNYNDTSSSYRLGGSAELPYVTTFDTEEEARLYFLLHVFPEMYKPENAGQLTKEQVATILAENP